VWFQDYIGADEVLNARIGRDGISSIFKNPQEPFVTAINAGSRSDAHRASHIFDSIGEACQTAGHRTTSNVLRFATTYETVAGLI